MTMLRKPRNAFRTRRTGLFGLGCALTLSLLAGLAHPAVAQQQDSKSKKSDKAKNDKQKSASHTASASAKTAPGARKVVLVFPSDTKGGVSDELVDTISEVEKSRLQAAGGYRSVYFLPSLAVIRRALTEQTLNAQDVRSPYDNENKLKKLVQLTGYNMVLVSSVEDYQFDADSKVVNLVMSARLVDYSTETPTVRSAARGSVVPHERRVAAVAQRVVERLEERVRIDEVA